MNRLSPFLLIAALLTGCVTQPPAPPDAHHPMSPDATAGPTYHLTPLSDDVEAAAPSEAVPASGGHHHGH